MLTEVEVERGALGPGVIMVFRDLGHRVRMLFDPQQTTEAFALCQLRMHVPRLVGEAKVIHHADT